MLKILAEVKPAIARIHGREGSSLSKLPKAAGPGSWRNRSRWTSTVRGLLPKLMTTPDSLGLDSDTLYAAGLFHDCGKAHHGWQLQVNGGDPAALQNPALAKGPFVPSPLSRLPRGWRHEAESLKRLPDDASALLHWLVATHHGHARPFWPIPEHGIGLADMMDRLQHEYGYWGLALFEAVLRCADRKVSEEEMADAGA